MTKNHPGYIAWLMSENGKQFPAFIMNTDADKLAQGLESLASMNKKEIILADLSSKEYKLGCGGEDGLKQRYVLCEQRVNKDLNRKDLRRIRWIGKEGNKEFYTDIYERKGKAYIIRVEKCDEFIRSGGKILYYKRLIFDKQKQRLVNVFEYDETPCLQMLIRWKLKKYNYIEGRDIVEINAFLHEIDNVFTQSSGAEISGLIHGPGYTDILIFGHAESWNNEDIYRAVKMAFRSYGCPYGSCIIRYDLGDDIGSISDKITISDTAIRYLRNGIIKLWKMIIG